MTTIRKSAALFFALTILANLSPAQALMPTTARDENWTGIAASLDGNRLVAVSYSGEIYVSKNGERWKPVDAPPLGWEAVACSGDGLTIVACSDYGSIYLSHDGGDHWTVSMQVAEELLDSVTMSADGRKIAVVNFYDTLVYRSTNSGVSWQSNSIANLDNYQSFEFPRCIAGSADGVKLMAGSISGTIFSSTNSGIDWVPTSAPTGNWSSVAMSHDGKRSVACDALGGGIYLSHDFGESWEMAKVPGNNWYAVTGSWDGRVLVAVAGGSDYDDPGPVYSSVDWGDTWQKIPGTARAW